MIWIDELLMNYEKRVDEHFNNFSANSRHTFAEILSKIILKFMDFPDTHRDGCENKTKFEEIQIFEICYM